MPILQGGIVMWAGSIQEIPAGWALCDGTNGTIDLRNKFVIGAGDIYAVGNTGGSTDTVLIEHTHNAFTNSSTNHTHDAFLGFVNSGGGAIRNSAVNTSFTTQTRSFNAGTSAHTHTAADTTSTAFPGETGVNKNLPPYYALAFIQQIS
jgi:hypothetical protein